VTGSAVAGPVRKVQPVAGAIVGLVGGGGFGIFKNARIGGLGAGGMGYYAIDVSDPTSPPILGSVGTPLLYEVSNALGAIRTKNSQLNAWSESLNADEVEKYVEKMIGCSSCIVHCRHRNTLGGEGPEYTALGLVGANIGMEDTAHVIELNNLCNELGLDISSSGTILAWAFELYERGIIDREMTGEALRFGDFELSKRLLRMISRREGFGDILAESTRNVERFGEASRDYLIAVKGLPQSDPHDVRYMKAFALGIATSSRGADHLRSRPTLEIFFNLPKEVRERIYGEGVPNDPAIVIDADTILRATCPECVRNVVRR